MFLSTHFYYCRNAQKEKNKVFGFVLFDTVEDKEAAHKVLDTLEYKGNKLIVCDVSLFL